jgi:RNA polymerase I-specific transcription initiation factor RRN7
MLHLSMLSDPVPEDPFLEAQSDHSTRNTRPELSRPSSPSSSSEEDDQTREEDTELAELLRQNSETSSQEESGDEQPSTNATRTRGHSKNEGPAMNLAVLMVALWTMRIPVLYRDFVR